MKRRTDSHDEGPSWNAYSFHFSPFSSSFPETYDSFQDNYISGKRKQTLQSLLHTSSELTLILEEAMKLCGVSSVKVVGLPGSGASLCFG